MSLKLVSIFFLLLAQSIAMAFEITHPLTIAELIDIALKTHPSTRQAWWRAHRVDSTLGSAKSAYYPKLNLTAQTTHGKDFQFINGPDTTYTILNANLTVSMLLYDFGERQATVEAAKMALLAANWQEDWNMQQIIIRVLENAYLTLYAQDLLKSTMISLEESEKVLQAAKELNEAGVSCISDVYTSRAMVSQMRIEFADQRSKLDIQQAKLAVSLGLSADAEFDLMPLNQIPKPQIYQLNRLIELARSKRADLMAKYAQISESLSHLNQTKASYKPEISLTGYGGLDHAVHDKANGAHYQLSLNLNIPLFNGFETTYQNKIAYANTRLSKEELAQLQLDISLEVLTHGRLLQAAQEKLPEAEENLKDILEAYQSMLEQYLAGKERITEVSFAQRQLAIARARYSEIKTQYLLAIANLAYATGILCETNP